MLTDGGEYLIEHPALKLVSIRKFRVSDKPVEVTLSDEGELLHSACGLKGVPFWEPFADLQ